MSGGGTIQEVLSATGEGVGCRHRFEPEPGINLALLTRLGLVASINTRIPACSAHGCSLLGQCAHQADFESGQPGRAGRKFRLTPEGLAAVRDPVMIAQVVGQAPATAEVLTVLSDGTANVFELAARLLDAEIQRLDIDNGSDDERSLTRRELGALLRLLAELDLIEIGEDGVSLRKVTS